MLSDEVALFSIKPIFAQAILSGEKKYEFRRGSIKKDIEFILIYASAPTKAFVGFARVEQIVSGSPRSLWRIAGREGGISYRDFMNYFDGKGQGHAIKIKEIYKFDMDIDPAQIIEDFRPPQSFMYVEDAFLDRLCEVLASDEEDRIPRRCARCR